MPYPMGASAPPLGTLIKAPTVEEALTLLCRQTGYVWVKRPDGSVIVEQEILHYPLA